MDKECPICKRKVVYNLERHRFECHCGYLTGRQTKLTQQKPSNPQKTALG